MPEHFITIAGEIKATGIYWWCTCGAEGIASMEHGFSSAAKMADTHVSIVKDGVIK